MEAKLKPCPFCRNAAEMGRVFVTKTETWDHLGTPNKVEQPYVRLLVACVASWCAAQMTHTVHQVEYERKADAYHAMITKRWNTRGGRVPK